MANWIAVRIEHSTYMQDCVQHEQNYAHPAQVSSWQPVTIMMCRFQKCLIESAAALNEMGASHESRWHLT